MNAYTLLTLAPSPLFLFGFFWSVFNSQGMQASMCGGSFWEMPAMWFIMFLAHLTPWFLWWQKRNLTRN